MLGVSRNSTDVELKKQYKRLALALHPDKNRAPQADEAFKGSVVVNHCFCADIKIVLYQQLVKLTLL